MVGTMQGTPPGLACKHACPVPSEHPEGVASRLPLRESRKVKASEDGAKDLNGLKK